VDVDAGAGLGVCAGDGSGAGAALPSAEVESEPKTGAADWVASVEELTIASKAGAGAGVGITEVSVELGALSIIILMGTDVAVLSIVEVELSTMDGVDVFVPNTWPEELCVVSPFMGCEIGVVVATTKIIGVVLPSLTVSCSAGEANECQENRESEVRKSDNRRSVLSSTIVNPSASTSVT